MYDVWIKEQQRVELQANRTDSDNSVKFIASKLKECLASHRVCSVAVHDSKPKEQWPSRLLDLETFRGGTIRLVAPQVEGGKDYTYAALSYRWGDNPSFRTLTGATLEELEAGVEIRTLPPMFRDAMSATVALGLRYLWIDGLCIMQDSEQDWQAEAPKMARVYGNCRVNLAGVYSKDTDGGLFRTRDPLVVNGCRGIFPSGPKPATEHVCSWNSMWRSHVERGGLYSRGWVLQERILSPRTVHFTTLQPFWECRELVASEQDPSRLRQDPTDHSTDYKPLKVELAMLKTPSATPAEAMSIWDRVLNEFVNTMSLTKGEDRLMALAGVAEVVKSALPGDEYLAGHWRSRLLAELIWNTVDNVPLPTPGNPGIPTWAWTSSKFTDRSQAVLFRMLHWSFKDSISLKAEVLEAHVCPIDNPFGLVKGGHLLLRTRSCTAYLDVERKVTTRSGNVVIRQELTEVNGQPATSKDFYLFLTIVPPRSSHVVLIEILNNWSLVLFAVCGEHDTFYRIGACSRDKQFGQIYSGPKCTVKIV